MAAKQNGTGGGLKAKLAAQRGTRSGTVEIEGVGTFRTQSMGIGAMARLLKEGYLDAARTQPNLETFYVIALTDTVIDPATNEVVYGDTPEDVTAIHALLPETANALATSVLSQSGQTKEAVAALGNG